jgi:hypothetical protein
VHDQLLPARQLFLPSTGRRQRATPCAQHVKQSERRFTRETCALIPLGTVTRGLRSKPCPFFKKDRIARLRSRSFCATSTTRRCSIISAVVYPHDIPPRLIPPPLPAVHLRLRGAAVLQVQLPPILSSYPVGYHNLRSVCQEAMDECGASEAKTSYRCNLLRETGEMPLVGPSVSRKLNRDLQANYLHPPATGAPRPLPRTLSFLICSFVFKKGVGRDGKSSKCRGLDDAFLARQDFFTATAVVVARSCLRCAAGAKKPHVWRRFRCVARHTFRALLECVRSQPRAAPALPLAQTLFLIIFNESQPFSFCEREASTLHSEQHALEHSIKCFPACSASLNRKPVGQLFVACQNTLHGGFGILGQWRACRKDEGCCCV